MENKPKPVDRRVLKTKRAIRNAFAKLMVEKDINDITIMELAETADINRKTFYNYYSGVYQVVEDIEHDILSSYAELLGGVEFREYMDAPVSLFNRFSQLINMDPVAQLEVEAYKADIVIDFVLSGMLSVYQHWFSSDRSVPAEEVSQIISTMSFGGINGVLSAQG